MHDSVSVVQKAVIPVAGYGTRRLPITKALEKCMLPVCNRPIVDYTVEACVAAGITEIIFVVAPEHSQLRAYYEERPELESYLAQHDNQDALALSRTVPAGVTFRFVVQDPAGTYGTAVPVWLAREYIDPGEQFLVLMGDDFVYNPQAPAEDIDRLVQVSRDAGVPAGLMAVEVAGDRISRYAAIETAAENDTEYFVRLTEKPEAGTARTTLANISKYLFDTTIFDFIEPVMAVANSSGEHYLTDAVNAYVKAGNKLVVSRARGIYLDGGNLDSWIEANQVVYRHAGLL